MIKFRLNLDKLFKVRGYINYKGNVKQVEEKHNNFELFPLYLVHPNHVWSAKREFQVQNPLDLYRVIKRQKKRIAPFEGKVYWKFGEFNKNFLSIYFYAVPASILDKLDDKYKFIVPAKVRVSKQPVFLNTPPVLVENSDKKRNLLNLIGLYSPAKEKKRSKEILSPLKMLIAVFVISTLGVGGVSAALLIKHASVANKVDANKALVDEALSSQREGYRSIEKLSQLSTFFSNNRSALLALEQLNIPNENVIVNRIEVSAEGATIYGYTSQSATLVLSSVLTSEKVVSAKFTRPVGNNSKGEETFTIEVLFNEV